MINENTALSHLRTTSVAEEQVIRKLLELSKALHHFHDTQRCHGALVPESIELKADGTIKIHASEKVTNVSSLVRLQYASPEQAGKLLVSGVSAEYLSRT